MVVPALLVVPSSPALHTAPWPREGSSVEYELRSSFTAPDGSYHVESTSRLALVYDGTAWNGTCAGETLEVVDGVPLLSTWSSPSGGRPASAPTGARRGETVVVTLLDDPGVAQGCWQRSEDVAVVAGGRRAAGEELEETSAYQDVTVTWDRKTGLVQDWSRQVRSGSTAGRLVASDGLGIVR